MPDTLKPCPFCGGKAFHDHKGNIAMIRCVSCPACTRVGYKRNPYEWAAEKAVAAWNKRIRGE